MFKYLKNAFGHIELNLFGTKPMILPVNSEKVWIHKCTRHDWVQTTLQFIDDNIYTRKTLFSTKVQKKKNFERRKY